MANQNIKLNQNTAKLKQRLEEMDEQFYGKDDIFGMTLLTNPGYISSARNIMFTNHLKQLLNLLNPDFPRVFTNYENIVEVLSQLEIEKYFSKINSAEFFELGKPHPAIYNDVVASLGVDRERVLVIEDSKSGIRAAKLAGLKVFAIRDDRFGMDQSEADAIISGVLELFDK